LIISYHHIWERKIKRRYQYRYQ